MIGSVLVNNDGFCVANKGTSSPEAATSIFTVIQKASQIHPDLKTPVVTIDYGDK